MMFMAAHTSEASNERQIMKAYWTSELNISIVMNAVACDRATAIEYLEAEEGDIGAALHSLRGDRG